MKTAARVLLGLALLLGAAVNVEAQGRLGETESFEDTAPPEPEPQGNATTNESAPANETTPSVPPPVGATQDEAASRAGEFYAEACLKSFRSRSRPYECAWKGGQRMYDHFWVLVHASHPFEYTVWLDGQPVTEGKADWRLEWNTTVTQQSVSVRVVVKDLRTNATGGHDTVEFDFPDMRVRASSGEDGESEDEEGEPGNTTERQVPIGEVLVARWKVVAGTVVIVPLTMFLVWHWLEGRQQQQVATRVL